MDQVWISLTAFLHFVGQQESFKGKVERLGKLCRSFVVPRSLNISARVLLSVAIFTPVLFRDDLDSPMPVSAVGKRRFLRYFIG